MKDTFLVVLVVLPKRICRGICSASLFATILIIHFPFSVFSELQYHWGDGLLSGVIICGGVVTDHFTILDMHPFTNTINLQQRNKMKQVDLTLLLTPTSSSD